MKTVSLHRAFDITIDTYEAFYTTPEDKTFITGALIFLFGLWLIGWGISFFIQVWMSEWNDKVIKWYWHTWLNRFALVVLFTVGMVAFANWYLTV